MLSTVQYVKGPIPLVWYLSCIIKNANLWLCLMKRINEKVIISSICSVESLPPGPAVIAASPHLAKRTRAKVEWIASPLSHTAFQMAYLLVMIHRPLPTSPPHSSLSSPSSHLPSPKCHHHPISHPVASLSTAKCLSFSQTLSAIREIKKNNFWPWLILTWQWARLD